MDKTLKEAVRRGIAARQQDPGYYDREAEKRTRRRDSSRDPVREQKATSVAWSRRNPDPSPALTDREKRARLPVDLPQQHSGNWETYDPITGEYLGKLSLL